MGVMDRRIWELRDENGKPLFRHADSRVCRREAAERKLKDYEIVATYEELPFEEGWDE